METLIQNRTEQIQSFVNLQLAGAAINQGNLTDLLSVKQLFANIQRFTDLEDLTFSEFLECLENLRSNFDIRDGQIGTDVNYMSLKKG